MHCSLLLSLVTVEALLLMVELSSDVIYKYISKHIANMHVYVLRTTGRPSSYALLLKAPRHSPPRPKLVRSLGPPELLLTGRLVAGQESANQG